MSGHDRLPVWGGYLLVQSRLDLVVNPDCRSAAMASSPVRSHAYRRNPSTDCGPILAWPSAEMDVCCRICSRIMLLISLAKSRSMIRLTAELLALMDEDKVISRILKERWDIPTVLTRSAIRSIASSTALMKIRKSAPLALVANVRLPPSVGA